MEKKKKLINEKWQLILGTLLCWIIVASAITGTVLIGYTDYYNEWSTNVGAGHYSGWMLIYHTGICIGFVVLILVDIFGFIIGCLMTKETIDEIKVYK